jgi:hypothetical protein
VPCHVEGRAVSKSLNKADQSKPCRSNKLYFTSSLVAAAFCTSAVAAAFCTSAVDAVVEAIQKESRVSKASNKKALSNAVLAFQRASLKD